MSLSSTFRRKSQAGREDGYILLTLMMLATLVIISLAIAAPQLSQQMKRDQEMELIHRGVQYSRAIKHFYKKTGRYPTRLEELDSFNNIRFLRKHYKDPITGQDFKLLHFGEVQIGFASGIAGGVAPGASPMGGLAAPNQQGSFGQQPTFGQQSAFGSPAGLNPQGSQGLQQPSMQQQTGSNENSPDNQVGGQGSGNTGPSSNPATQVASTGMAGAGQVFGGGPIVGVASTSKKKSIREFNKKNHYKDWQFIYDPSSDRGGLLNTPAQPQLNATQAGPGQGQGVAPGPQQQPGFGGQPNGNFAAPGMQPNQPPDQMAPPQQ